MKNQKTILVMLIITAMLFMIGCTANNEANENDTTQNEADNQLAIDYSKGLDEAGHFEEVQAVDFVNLPDYSSIIIPEDVSTITEETLQENINQLLADFTSQIEVTDRAVENGDNVNIDYVGSVDGVEFEGGSTGGAGTMVQIGVTQYIDDFLEQLIGHMPGESFDIEVTFPEDYGVDNLNGKDAIFAITINHIVEDEEAVLTDEFVKETFEEEYALTNVSDLEDFIKDELKKAAITNFVNTFIVENSEVVSVPESVLEFQETAMVNYYTISAASYGMELVDFIQGYAGYEDLEALIEASQDQIKSTSEYLMILQAIAEDSKLDVTEDDLTAYFVEYADSDDYTQFTDVYGMPYLKNLVLKEVVINHLVENAQY
jgi:trigger factor